MHLAWLVQHPVPSDCQAASGQDAMSDWQRAKL